MLIPHCSLLIFLSSPLKPWIDQYSLLLSDTCQLLSLGVITWGILQALFVALRDVLRHRQIFVAFQHSRLILGYSFSLSLSFILGSSIIKTMLTNNWQDIAQLAVVIGIRTVVNLLLERAARLSASADSGALETEDQKSGPAGTALG